MFCKTGRICGRGQGAGSGVVECVSEGCSSTTNSGMTDFFYVFLNVLKPDTAAVNIFTGYCLDGTFSCD